MADEAFTLKKSLKAPSQFQKSSELKPPAKFSKQQLLKQHTDVKKPSDFYATKAKVVQDKSEVVQVKLLSCQSNAHAMKTKQEVKNSLLISPKQYTKQYISKNGDLADTKQYISKNGDLADLNQNCVRNKADLYRNLEQDRASIYQGNVDKKNATGSSNVRFSFDASLVSKDRYLALELKYMSANKRIEELELELKDLSQVHEMGKSEWNKISERFKIKESTLARQIYEIKSENELLQDKVKHMDRDHFTEMKNVYDKYIVLQSQCEDEKSKLNKRLSELELKLSDIKIDKSNLLKALEQAKNKLKTNAEVAMESQCLNKETIEKLYVQISDMKEEIVRLHLEKKDSSVKLESFATNVSSLNKSLHEKNSVLEDLNNCLLKYKNNAEGISNDIESKKIALELLEKQVRDEINKNLQLECIIKEKEKEIKNVENDLNQMKYQVNNMSVDIEKSITLENQLKFQEQEMQQLQNTCKTLQSVNEFLNVRLSSVNEVLRLQELTNKEVLTGNKSDKLVQVWREKVYSLLVLLKTQEFKDKRNVSNQ